MVGKIKKVKDEEFERLVMSSEKPAVVDFWATWCEPCKRLDEVLEEMAAEYGEHVDFFRVDVNESQQTTSRFAVRSIPTLLFFQGGEIVDQAIGSISREVLDEKLRGLLRSA